MQDRKEWYKGPEGLKPNVARQLGDDPFDWFSHVSGCDYEAVARLARHSNEYFDSYIKPDLGPNKRYHGIKWVPITVQEMYRFLGLLLHMSLNKIDGGGYKAYFQANDTVIRTAPDAPPLVLQGTARPCSKYMSLRRFQQIRGVFHPEDRKAASGGDKCYQLRYVIRAFNKGSENTFETPCHCAFDEGGGLALAQGTVRVGNTIRTNQTSIGLTFSFCLEARRTAYCIWMSTKARTETMWEFTRASRTCLRPKKLSAMPVTPEECTQRHWDTGS